MEKATAKIKHFCSYQERCHREVKEKLYGFGLRKEEREEIVSLLIGEGYLNEERFAVEFAGGKFRIKQWGRVKIRYELKQKAISDYCIKKGLQAIHEEDYAKTLEQLFEKKLKTLQKEKNIFLKKSKVQAFLLQRGFEPSLVQALIQKIGE